MRKVLTLTLTSILCITLLSGCLGVSSILQFATQSVPSFTYRPTISKNHSESLITNLEHTVLVATKLSNEEKSKIDNYMKDNVYMQLNVLNKDNLIDVDKVIASFNERLKEGTKEFDLEEMAMKQLRKQLLSDNDMAKDNNLSFLTEYQYDLDMVVEVDGVKYLPILTTTKIVDFTFTKDDYRKYVDKVIEAMKEMDESNSSEITNEERKEAEDSIATLFSWYRKRIGEYLLLDYKYYPINFESRDMIELQTLQSMAFTSLSGMNSIKYGYNGESYFDKPSDWSNEAVSILTRTGAISKELGDNWKKLITREEFVTVFMRYFEFFTYEKGIKSNYKDKVTFSDTNSRYAIEMSELGWIKGTGDNKFNPTDYLTREQVATIVSNVIKIETPPRAEIDWNRITKFNDHDQISDWALESVYICSENGAMKGVGDNHFSPKGKITVEEAIVIIERLLSYRGIYEKYNINRDGDLFD